MTYSRPSTGAAVALALTVITTPAAAKHHKDEPVAEIQRGDRHLSCADIRAQLDQTAAAEKSGKFEDPARPKSRKFFARLGRVGGQILTGGLIKTAVSVVPFGGLAKNIPLPGEGAKDAIRESAKARHGRLITLYDRRACD